MFPPGIPAVTGRIVAVCTSGDIDTQPQSDLVCQMMTSLGWRPVRITGMKRDDAPPKSWRIGCKATFAWMMRLAPEICRLAGSLREPLMVAEDSAWPTDRCTPSTVEELHSHHGKKPLWLACYLKPKMYSHDLNGRTFHAKASAGSKLFYGNADFWRKVKTLFDKCGKQFSTDAVFQTLVGMEELEFIYPALGATLKHISGRCNFGVVDASPPLELQGSLLALPQWIQHSPPTHSV